MGWMQDYRVRSTLTGSDARCDAGGGDRLAGVSQRKIGAGHSGGSTCRLGLGPWSKENGEKVLYFYKSFL
jgi:hypothetical protein